MRFNSSVTIHRRLSSCTVLADYLFCDRMLRSKPVFVLRSKFVRVTSAANVKANEVAVLQVTFHHPGRWSVAERSKRGLLLML